MQLIHSCTRLFYVPIFDHFVIAMLSMFCVMFCVIIYVTHWPTEILVMVEKVK